MQISKVNEEYFNLEQQHKTEMIEAVESEKEKARQMAEEHLTQTVVDMMKDIDIERKALSRSVNTARDIAQDNDELTKIHKQLAMEVQLLQQEHETMSKKVKKNDQTIRSLADKLKQEDQELTESSVVNERDIDQPDQNEESLITEEEEDESEYPFQRQLRYYEQFSHDTVDVLCDAAVKCLDILDNKNIENYRIFHENYQDNAEKEKELRFLMSKIGNLSSVKGDDFTPLPPIDLSEVEGSNEEIVQTKLIDPQFKAIFDFAEPIADDEFPDLIATHFFQ